MTEEEKLKKLYGIKMKLHPLTMVVVVGLTETKDGILDENDRIYINDIYPIYFP